MHLRQARLELGGAHEVGPLELATQPTFVEPEQQLLAGALVDLVTVGACAQFRPERDELVVFRTARDEDVPEATVERVVEMLGRERGELLEQRRMPNDRREQVTLALDARLEQPGRRRRRITCRPTGLRKMAL